MDILVRSWQDLVKILEQSWLRSCHGIHFAMARSYQESHVPQKNFIVKSYLTGKKCERRSTKCNKMQQNAIYARYKILLKSPDDV